MPFFCIILKSEYFAETGYQFVGCMKMKDDLQVDAFKKFWKVYTEEEIEGCGLVPFEDHKLDSSCTMGMIYDGMEPGFTQELINSINRFSHEIDVLKIWSKYIFPTYSEEEQFELSYLFLELPFYYCLNQPQSIRDRIIFSATHLCHQANLFIKIPGYKDELPEDRKIGEKTLTLKVGNWNTKEILIPAIKTIASDDYIEKTYNYRNMAHHRVPPSLQYGHTNFMRRLGYQESSFEYTTFENGIEVKKKKHTKGVSYSFGYIPPLKAEEAILLFKEQHKLLKGAFSCYWQLIQEHCQHKK